VQSVRYCGNKAFGKVINKFINILLNSLVESILNSYKDEYIFISIETVPFFIEKPQAGNYDIGVVLRVAMGRYFFQGFIYLGEAE